LKRAVILVANLVQDQEFCYPHSRLLEANFVVDVASPTLDIIYGKHGIKITPTCTFKCLLFKDIHSTFLNHDCPDVIIIPGGWGSPEIVRQDRDALEYLKHMDGLNVIIGAICHGPWVAISADIVRGRKMTCYQGMKDDLINAGAVYVDAPVVVDGNIVTSPHYNNCHNFMGAIIQEIEDRKHVRQ